jgi:hypothetical protein
MNICPLEIHFKFDSEQVLLYKIKLNIFDTVWAIHLIKNVNQKFKVENVGITRLK